MMNTRPPISAIRKIARGMTFSAFSVSSDRVVTASKPRNEKHRMVAPATRALRWVSSPANGSRLQVVPRPSPLCRPRMVR
ncbi:hypothetical protein D3C79_976220 [compost metagenome]